MNIIYMLLAISVFVAIVFFVLFIVSVRKGQYDDTYTPSVRMLFEDELVKEGGSIKSETSKEKITNSKK
ncbi:MULTISPECIES: cbb3-type cytochrome oxidase assembly protein CcoS [Aequorivita]|jgi:cbb3-type cytochrome oxidase maturation protein|uniref:Cytochrome oxidase maturation protein, cbb3-type n=1 Tax=Aequorivita soesokkakensis TaxID=1385699 RepID=A0A1A9LAJ5_9FLAO|nr:cbb3-type cytochrome oxidase assembly protein CcoS [Aequorivita soesokkakensis]OAD90213.1 cytochrome oxidase maturation protein, cbb3-type [Aequorivita soesokkakensis]